MNKFLDDMIGGVVLGLILGTVLSLLFWVHSLDETISYREMKRDIDNNVTVKLITYKKFPTKYKLDYTDWEGFDKP
jgi:hypothetical protein